MDTANDKGEEEEGLCEYEKQRLKKIKENRAFLASLDLGAAKEELKEVTKKQVKVSLGLHNQAYATTCMLFTCKQ